MKHVRICFLVCPLVLFILTLPKLQAQNLDKVGQKDMITVAGGINFNSMIYDAYGLENQREPFVWSMSGNVTATILDVSLPFVFNYSNNHVSYSQPMNFQSLNPKYKWVQAYLGNTSMSLSKYSLSGHMFSGAGLQLTPKNVKVSMMYGRLMKAIEYNPVDQNDDLVSFRRMGFGVSAEYIKNSKSFKLVYFTAKDDEQSLMSRPINTVLMPMQNTVLSAIVKYPLPWKINIDAEYAISGLTRNIGYEGAGVYERANQLPVIFKTNSTSQFFHAVKTGIGYSHKGFRISANYERIAPGYTTLGTYYFTNDCENFTLAPSFSLLKGKLSISANTGLQHDNLDGSKVNTTKRWVGTANVSFMPNKKWAFNSSFSNFSNYTRYRLNSDPFDLNPMDSMNIYQVSKSAMLSSNYKFGGEKTQHTISFTGNYQNSGQQQGSFSDPGIVGSTGESFENRTSVYCGNVSWNLNLKKSKTGIVTALNANLSKMTNAESLFIGPTASVNRAFLQDKLRFSLGATYNQMFTNNVKSREILNYRMGIRYTPKKSKEKASGKIAFNAGFGLVQRLKSATTSATAEFTGNIGINYTF